MRKQMWEIRQATETTLSLYIYGDVTAGGYDWRKDEITESETSASHFREELGKYPNAAQINLYINSYGGSVFEGTAIYNQLKRHPAHKTVYVDGFACSVASVIAMAGDEIIMPKNTMMMIHNAWMGAVGSAAELRKAADDLDAINNAGKQAYLQKAGGKLGETALSAMMDAETWLTAEECIRYGLADRFAEEDADLSGTEKILQKANLNMERRIQEQKSLAAQLRELTNMPNDIAGGKNGGHDDINLHIETVGGADSGDIQRLVAELEFYRGQQTQERQKTGQETNSIMQTLRSFFITERSE